MQKGSTEPLPIDGHLAAIVDQVRTHRALVVTAAPGAGKTTRVPPALVVDGPVLLLQPRRVAARAIAQRIAEECGWTVGREVGWHIRFDRRDCRETRLLVATEGILTARLQQDPLLSDFTTIVLDEFHERSIHSDVGLALARQAWLARDDLRIVVMSATIDATTVAAFLGGCPVVDVPGRVFPVDVSYRPDAPIEDVITEHVPAGGGAVLAFLPGAREIADVASRVRGRLGAQVQVIELHGGLDATQQDAALVSSERPRVILSTNIAETTLTVPDVCVVVDAGWQKVARYDADRGIDRLDTERISRDAADQRAGRAGRVRAGCAIRLWDRHVRLASHREPDITRVDLASPALDLIAWGAHPSSFEWFEAPRADRLDAALDLLRRLGAIDAAMRLTPMGRTIQRLPLHPRLARLLVAAGGAPEAARAVALLSERRRSPAAAAPAATACDLWAAAESDVSPSSTRAARDIMRLVSASPLKQSIAEDEFRRAVLAGYPDRVARRRASGGDRLLLASGAGAQLARWSGVVNHEWLVAVDVGAGGPDRGGEALVRMACGIERDWLTPTAVTTTHTFDPATGVVRAEKVARYDALVLSTTHAPTDPAEVSRLLVEAAVERGPDEDDSQILARSVVAGLDLSFEALVREAAPLVRRLDDVRLAALVPGHVMQRLARDAPATLPLPSGRRATLTYRPDGRIVAAVKLQELFGLAETPRIGPSRIPVTFELLSPGGRPVQVTSDLRSFWATGYQEVRRELRARYPRHPWPEDPWTAQPTHRTVRRS